MTLIPEVITRHTTHSRTHNHKHSYPDVSTIDTNVEADIICSCVLSECGECEDMWDFIKIKSISIVHRGSMVWWMA